MSEKFYVYSKESCGYCQRLTQFMSKKGVDFALLNLYEDFTVEDFLNKFGQGSTFPQVNYKNQNLGGMRETVKYMISEHLV